MPLDAGMSGVCVFIGCWLGTCAWGAGWNNRASGSLLPHDARQMASGVFIGLTEDELLAIKSKAVTAITLGLNVVSYSDSGSSASKAWAMQPKEMLTEALFALSTLDPLVYGYRRTIVSTNWNNRIDQ
jgi:hypothetical protein